MSISLAAGKEIIAIPGPTVVPDRVLTAMHRAMPDIYAGELTSVIDEVYEALPELAGTSSRAFVTISNGHGAWAMALSNTLSRGDKVLVLECGRFAGIWAKMATFDGVEVEMMVAESGRSIDPELVAERLANDSNRELKAVLMVHVDTASSAKNDIAAIRQALDTTDHPALLMVDCVASLGCEPFNMDTLGVDVTVAASQKGLMMPPGLGFVWAGSRARAAHASADLRTHYWDWTQRTEDGPYYVRFCGTPPVTHLFGLQEALRMINEEGLEARWDRHRVLADAVRNAVETWAVPNGLSLHVTHATERANSVSTIMLGVVEGTRLATTCREQAGVTLGLGIGDLADVSFRIGHMGHVNAPMVLGVLGTIEAALLAIEAPMNIGGVSAAAATVSAAW